MGRDRMIPSPQYSFDCEACHASVATQNAKLGGREVSAERPLPAVAGGEAMLRAVICASALAMALVDGASAQEPLKIGLIQSLTGPFSTVGKATVNGAQLYVQQHGDVVAGRRIELAVSDDATAPDRPKRIAQVMILIDGTATVCAR